MLGAAQGSGGLGSSQISMLLLGLCAIPLCVQLLRLATQHRILGVLMIILSQMMYDVSLFLVLFSSYAIGFGLAFIAVMSAQASWYPILTVESWADVMEPLASGAEWDLASALGIPFWAALGEPRLERVEDSSPLVGTLLLWVYVVASQILLVNLLIAMMGNTYQKYAVNAEKEFYFNRATVAIEARAYFAVPPPLSLPLLLLMPSTWRGGGGDDASSDHTHADDDADGHMHEVRQSVERVYMANEHGYAAAAEALKPGSGASSRVGGGIQGAGPRANSTRSATMGSISGAVDDLRRARADDHEVLERVETAAEGRRRCRAQPSMSGAPPRPEPAAATTTLPRRVPCREDERR